MKIAFILDEIKVEVNTSPEKKLSWVLRNLLYQKQIKEGCSNGYCGSCVIFLDDQLVPSCRLPVFKARGARIETISGFSTRQAFQDIIRAFKMIDVLPCSFCAPGKVLGIESLLRKSLDIQGEDRREEIKQYLAAFTCRCISSREFVKTAQLAARLREKRLARIQ